MKRLRKALLPLLTAALLFSTCSPAFAYWEDKAFLQAENVIQNPGFEDGGTGWETEYCAAEEAAAFSGELGMRFTASGSTLRQELEIPFEEEYEFNMHLLQPYDDLGAITVKLISDEGTQEFFNIFTGPDWQRCGFTATLKNHITLEIYGGGANTGPYLDDLYLVPTASLGEPGAARHSLIANGSFEAGISGWEPYHKKNTTLAWGGESYDGSHSLKVLDAAKRPSVYTMLPDADVGEYELTARVYVPGNTNTGATLSIGVTASDEDDWLRLFSPTMEVPLDWNGGWVTLRCLSTFSLTAKHKLIISGSGMDSFYVDDVSVRPTGYDPSVPPEPDPEPVNVSNASFENGLTSWTPTERLNIFTTNSQSFLGASSAYFAYFEPSPMEQYLSQTCRGSGAGTYTLSARLRPDANLSGDGAVVVLEALSASGAVVRSVASAPINSMSGWQYASATLDAPEGTASLRIKIGGKNITGGFYADAVELYRTP